jgi:hypothetical protein
MMVTLTNETGWNVPRLDGRMMNRIELKEEEKDTHKNCFFLKTYVD